jgi:hypothetical protein
VPALIPKTDANITLSVNAPNEIEISEGEYYPNPLEIKAVAGNTGDIAAQNVQAEINLPKGMELASGNDVVNIGTIEKDAEFEVIWQINVEPDDKDRTFAYSVTLTSDNAQTQTVEKTLFVPAIEEEKTEAGIELQLKRSRLMDGNTLSMDFKLVNTGTETYDLNKLSARYYYMDEFPTATKVFNVHNAQFQQPYMDINNAAVSVKNNALEETLSGANAYIEFNFTANAQLVPGQEAIVNAAMNTPDYKNMSVKNDYSYIGDEPEDTYDYAAWEYMPVYLSGEEEPIWGEEPEEGDENAAEASDLLVELDPNNTKSNYNAMSIQMRLTNPGVEPVDLGKTEILYYYTNDRIFTQIANADPKEEIVIDEIAEIFSVNGTITYHENPQGLLKSKTEAKLFLLSEFREMANVGLSITFKEDAGVLGYNDSIDLQISIHKPDYSGLYTQESLEDDFSYLEVANEDLDVENTPGFRSAGNVQVIVQAEKAREKDELRAAALLRDIRKKYGLDTGEAQLNITGNQPARKKWPGNVIKAFATSSDIDSDEAPGWIVLFTPDELKDSWNKYDEIEFYDFDSFIRKERTVNGDILVEFPSGIYEIGKSASIPVENTTRGDLGQLKINFSTDGWLHFERSSVTGSLMDIWQGPYPDGVEVDTQLEAFISNYGPSGRRAPTDTLSATLPPQISTYASGNIDYTQESADELSDYNNSVYEVWYDDTDVDDKYEKHTEDFDFPYKAIGYLGRHLRHEGAYVLKITEGKEDKEIFKFNSNKLEAPTFYLFAGNTLKGITENSNDAKGFTMTTQATNPHVIRSDGLFAWTGYEFPPTSQKFAHRAERIVSENGTKMRNRFTDTDGAGAEGNTGAYVYRQSVNNNAKTWFRVVEKVDFSDVELTVLNYTTEAGTTDRALEDDKQGTLRNAYIFISSVLNDNGTDEGYASCDLGLLASRETEGKWQFFGPTNWNQGFLKPKMEETENRLEGDQLAFYPVRVNGKYGITTNEKGEEDENGVYTTYTYEPKTYWFVYEFVPDDSLLVNGVKATFSLYDEEWEHATAIGTMIAENDDRYSITKGTPGYINFSSCTSFVPKNEFSVDTDTDSESDADSDSDSEKGEANYYLDDINSGEALINVVRSDGKIYFRNDDKTEDWFNFSGTDFNYTKDIILCMSDKLSHDLFENSEKISIVYQKTEAEVKYRLNVANNRKNE